MSGALVGLGWGSGGGRKHNRTSREKRKQNEPSQTTIKGEIVEEPKILLQEFFLFS